ncbi:MAG: hypothetical protein JWO08_2282, partial [Verrucomicrobiaceae bacterium]|nr:hypothetical protein [Verrucomicrobiaceae bacterium]
MRNNRTEGDPPLSAFFAKVGSPSVRQSI